MSGGGTNTVTNNSQPPQQFLDAYSNLLYRANQTIANGAPAPYAGGNPSAIVAGLSPDQQAAISQIQGTAGIAQPFINQAESYINQSNRPLAPTIAPYSNTAYNVLNDASKYTMAGGNGITSSDINNFENPYTQQVVNATQAQFNNQNAQQQQQIQGQAAQQGAFGGDRQAVQAGITAGQQQLAQAPVIAGLESQGFNTALSAAMQQKQLQQQAGQGLTAQAQGFTGLGNLNLGANEANNWLASQAGYGMANLGNESLNTTLAPAQALLGVGGLEQQIQQEQLNVPYENYIANQAFPYQSLNWLGGLSEGLGGAAGGTSSSSYPGASIGSQLTGGALTGLGLYGLANQTGLVSGIGGLFGAGAGAGAAALGGASVADALGTTAAAGGTLDAALSALPFLARKGGGIPRRAFGGIVAPHSNVIPFRPRLPHPANDAFPHSPIRQAAVGGIAQHFDSGGSVMDDLPLGFGDLVAPGGVDDYGGIVPQRDAPSARGIAPDVRVTPQGFSRWQDSVPPAGGPAQPTPSLALADVQPQGGGIVPPPPPSRSTAGSPGPAIMPTSAAPAASPEAPTTPPPPPQFTDAPAAAQTAAAPEHGGTAHGKMPWETLIAMGLGMMGGRSPNALTNIGEGGLKGLEFGEQVRAREENARLRELQQQELSQWHQATAANAADRNQTYAARVQGQSGVEEARAAYLRMRAEHPGLTQAQLQEQVMGTLTHTINPDTGQNFTPAEAYGNIHGFQFKQQAQDLALQKAFDLHNYRQAHLQQNASKEAALEQWRNQGMKNTQEWREYLKSKGATDQDIKTYLGLTQATGVAPKPEAAHTAAEGLRQQNAQPTAPAGQAPLPMPKSAADAIPGKVYNTARGPARWDGQQFIPE